MVFGYVCSDIVGVGKTCLGTTVFVSIVLFACSFGVIEPRNYGIIYDNNWRQIDSELQGNGRFFVGLGRSVIEYPRGLITLNWLGEPYVMGEPDEHTEERDFGSLQCWTSSGQNVVLELSLQVKLVKESILLLYYQWQTFEEARWHLKATIEGTVRDTTSTIPTVDFFQNRPLVKQRIDAALRNLLLTLGADDPVAKTKMRFYDLEHIQLRQISLPTKFEQAVLNKLLMFQSIKKATFSQRKRIAEAKIYQVGEGAEADMLYTLMKAAATGEFTIRDYEASVRKKIAEDRSSLYLRYITDLGLMANASDFSPLFFLMWSKVNKMSRAKHMYDLVGFDQTGTEALVPV